MTIYTIVPTVETGVLLTAANCNTRWRDNFAAGVPDIFTTKGDLAVGSGVDAAGRLPVGIDGQGLAAKASEALGMEYNWGLVQIGMIILWYGAIVDIPTGWQICDGTGGTPNLKDKFVVGAGSTYAVGATGGVLTHTHTQGNVGAEAAHTHTQADVSDENVHTHTQADTGSETAHTHTIAITTDGGSGGIVSGGAAIIEVINEPHHHHYSSATGTSTHVHTNPTTSAGSVHKHTNPTTAAGSSHDHTNPTTAAGTNTPSYKALVHIQRVS